MKAGGVALLGLPFLAAIALMAGRVGETARFVTWPIVVLTAMAATVALIGLWVGLDRPWMLAAGVLPGLMLAYFLPAAPVWVIACVLVGLAVLAARARGVAAGSAMTVGALMVLFIVLQGPAVDCGRSSFSSGSGPWWIASPSSYSSAGTGTPDGRFSGTTHVGDDRYTYVCADARLTRFERID